MPVVTSCVITAEPVKRFEMSLESEIGTAVEPFREKNNNHVKPACHKIYQEGIICLFSLPSLKYLFSAAILRLDQTLSVSIGTTIGQ